MPQKEYTFTISASELLKDITPVLFNLNVELNVIREQLKKECVGRTVQVGQFRGKITKVSGGKLLLEQNGVRKECVVSKHIMDQLCDTTRK